MRLLRLLPEVAAELGDLAELHRGLRAPRHRAVDGLHLHCRQPNDPGEEIQDPEQNDR